MDLTEFTAINNNGKRQEGQRSFSQSTTTAPQNWLWTGDSSDIRYALLVVEMSIGKFEYTSIEVGSHGLLTLDSALTADVPTPILGSTYDYQGAVVALRHPLGMFEGKIRRRVASRVGK